MTADQARQYVHDHDDQDELDDDDIEAAFRAFYDRPADDEDRIVGLWSLICAAA